MHNPLQAKGRALMGNLFKAMQHMVQRHDSLLSYESLLHLISEVGGDVGQREHSRNTAAAMIKLANKVGNELPPGHPVIPS